MIVLGLYLRGKRNQGIGNTARTKTSERNMNRIPIIGKGDASAYKQLALREGEMLRSISTAMNSLRLVKVIPTFYNFAQLEVWQHMSRDWSGAEKRKYGRWWDGLYHVMRDKSDKASVALFIAYLLQEQARRNGSKMEVVPATAGITDLEHAERVREYVLSHYEGLNPDIGIV